MILCVTMLLFMAYRVFVLYLFSTEFYCLFYFSDKYRLYIMKTFLTISINHSVIIVRKPTERRELWGQFHVSFHRMLLVNL